MPRSESFVLDIIRAAEAALGFVEDRTFEEFTEDALTVSGVLYQFIVIGEATNRLSAEFIAAHPEIEWHRMRGMRNRVAHGYDEVDYVVIWETIHQHLDPLIEKLKQLIPPEPDDSVTGDGQ